MFTIIKNLIAPYLSWVKLLAGVVVLGFMWHFIYQYRTGQEAKAELATVKQSLTDEIAAHNAYIATRAAQDSITAKVSTDYENAVTDLVGQLNDARATVRTVRVCNAAPKSPISTAASGLNAASEDRPSATNEIVVTEVSTDEPLEIAKEAAECGLRLNGLQDWIRKQNSLLGQ